MIAVVCLTGEHRELHRHKGMYLYTLLPHSLIEAVLHRPTSHVVVNKPYLDTFPCLGYQCIGNQPSQSVITEDEHVDMDMVPCLCYFSEQSRKELISVLIYLDRISLKGQCHLLVCKKVYELPVFFWQRKVPLLHELKHRPLCQLVKAFLRDYMLPPYVLPEEEVEDNAKQWYEPQHKYPRHGLCRLPVVHEDCYHGQHDHDGIDEQYEPMDVNHI